MPPERMNPNRTDGQLSHVLKVGCRDGGYGVAPQSWHAHRTTRNSVPRPWMPGRCVWDHVAVVGWPHVAHVVVGWGEVGHTGGHAAVVRII